MGLAISGQEPKWVSYRWDLHAGRKRIARIKTDCGRITIYDNDSLRIKNYVGPSGGNIDPTNCSDIDFFCRHLVSRGITIISVKHF